jgi:hypothetical protein
MYADAEIEEAWRWYRAFGHDYRAIPFHIYLGIHISAKRGDCRRPRRDPRGILGGAAVCPHGSGGG